jgi:hypothetical protein
VAYYYTCEGQQYPVFMTIPGRSCDGSSAGILGGLKTGGVRVASASTPPVPPFH